MFHVKYIGKFKNLGAMTKTGTYIASLSRKNKSNKVSVKVDGISLPFVCDDSTKFNETFKIVDLIGMTNG